jgi:hypothetical protein
MTKKKNDCRKNYLYTDGQRKNPQIVLVRFILDDMIYYRKVNSDKRNSSRVLVTQFKKEFPYEINGIVLDK